MTPLTFGSLFAGIGGIDLGLERAGMQCAWQVEWNVDAQQILAKHWPGTPRFNDVCNVGKHNLATVDLIAGGFPCQDISVAGKRIGIGGKRSGLWGEFYRIICELRPRYVLVENVSAILIRGIDRVLGDLAEGGYDAEWECIPAASVGAPHFRDRLFIVAYANGVRFGNTTEYSAEQHAIFSTTVQHSTQWSLSNQPRFGEKFRPRLAQANSWAPEPRIPRVVDGVPRAMDRLRGLGNAVVPQVAEFIGRQIVEYDNDIRRTATQPRR
jgi:DNA (cytosine-5)-methyltransferase 1